MDDSGGQTPTRRLGVVLGVVGVVWAIGMTVLVMEGTVGDGRVLRHPATALAVVVLVGATLGLLGWRFVLYAHLRQVEASQGIQAALRATEAALIARIDALEVVTEEIPKRITVQLIQQSAPASNGASVDPKVVEIGERLTRRLTGSDDH